MNSNPKLKRRLPPNRSYKQVLNHYLVERAIAIRLKQSTLEERQRIFETMYDELFATVPDHPRLVRRQDDRLTARWNQQKLRALQPFLRAVDRYVEFGAGDCRFCMHVAKRVGRAYAVDIADQRNPVDIAPSNFELVVYDGVNLDQIASDSIDLIFSDQLIEHFHPEDTRRHFELARRILKPGGKYVLRTPHAFSGPHDVSKYFCDEAEGFHLKEWTYIELKQLIFESQFSSINCYRFAKEIRIPLPFAYFWLLETLFQHASRRFTRSAAELLISGICIAAVK